MDLSTVVNYEIVSKECLEGKHKKCKKLKDCACVCHDPDAPDDEATEPENDEY
jgi:hypothetical protein